MWVVWCLAVLVGICLLISTIEKPPGWAVLLLLWPSAHAQSLTPSAALERYLAGPQGSQGACGDSVVAVRIDASLPSLKKRGSMSGFKLVSRTGEIVYAVSDSRATT